MATLTGKEIAVIRRKSEIGLALPHQFAIPWQRRVGHEYGVFVNFDEATRASLIAAGLKLFQQSSLSEVMVADIAREAGVTKKIFYKLYKTRDEFIVNCYRDFAAEIISIYYNITFDKVDARAKVQAIFAFLEGVVLSCKFMGCGFMRAAAAVGHRVDHPLRQVVSDFKKTIESEFASMLECEGFSQPRHLARELVIILDGTLAQAMYHREPGYVLDGARLALMLVDQSSRQDDCHPVACDEAAMIISA